MSNEVQVSNARRIGFTALALVSFWVLAWEAYRGGWHEVTSLTTVFCLPRQFLWSVCFALPSAILLSLSVYNFPLKLRDGWMLTSTILFSVTMAVCYGLGESDAVVAYRLMLEPFGSWPRGKSAPPDPQWTPSLWLLLPIILTTAFVIFGAWRRGRDAEVAAAGEDD